MLPIALPGGGRWVRQAGTVGRFQAPAPEVPLLTGLAWVDGGVAPGGKVTLRATGNDADRPWLPEGVEPYALSPFASPHAVRLTGRMTAADPARPDGRWARTLGRSPSRDEVAAWGVKSTAVPLRAETFDAVFDLDASATADRVRPVLDVVQRERRDRYVGPPLEVWPAPTFVDGPRWDAADPGVFRPSRRFNAVAVDEGAELTVVARLRPDDDVRCAELRVRAWAVAGGMGGVMDALPRAGWVPRVWQDVFVCVGGEGPDPFGDVRFRWRAERHGPTERAVAHLRAASPSAAGPLAARPAVYLAWVRVNGVVRSLPPLDVVGPEPPPRSTLS